MDSEEVIKEYKHRPRSRPLEHERVTEVRIRPKVEMMEMDIALDTESANFSRNKASRIADSNINMFPSGVMDTYSLRAYPCGDHPSGREAVGYIMDGALHLIPMTNRFMLLEPTHDHLIKAKEKETLDAHKRLDEAELQSVKPVQLKFDRVANTARTFKDDAVSYKTFQARINEEPWQRCLYVPFDEDTAYAKRMPLMCPQEAMEEECNLPVVSRENYLRVFAPPVPRKLYEKSDSGNTGLLSQLKRMALPEQVRKLMINAKAMRFIKLVDCLRDVSEEPESVTPPAVLRHVQQIALLVRGCWVVKSEVLYPPNTRSAHSEVSADLLCKARDYILWFFHAGRHLTRKEISSVIKLPSMEVCEILEQMSRRRQVQAKGSINRWEFCLDYDFDFVRKHPDVVQQQEQWWEARIQQLCTLLKIDKPKPMKESERPVRRRTRSRHSASDSSDTDGDHSMHSSGGRRGRRRSNSSGPGTLHSSKPRRTSLCSPPPTVAGEREASLLMPPPVAMDTSPACARLTTSSAATAEDSPTLPSDMMVFLQEKLSSRPLISLSHLVRLYQVRPCAATNKLLSPGELAAQLDATAREIGARCIQCCWPEFSKLQKETVYSGASDVDDLHTQYRNTLFSLLEQQPGVTLTVFRKTIEETSLPGLPSPDDRILRKLLKKYCIYRNTRYLLRYTVEDTETTPS